MSFELDTTRLTIRSFRPEEEALYIAVHQDPAVNEYLPVRSAEEYHDVFQKALVTPDAALNRWCILLRGHNEFIGSCLLREFNPGDDKVIELGYSFAARYWGKGYASEMIAGMVSYVYTLPGIEKLVAVTHPDNKASQAVLMKNGFRYMGEVTRYEGLELTYFEHKALD